MKHDEFTLTAMTQDYARTIAQWQYDGAYAFYNHTDAHIDGFMDGAHFACVCDDGALIGYFCFGSDARIPTVEPDVYEDDAVDIGLGMRPDLCGKGLGLAFVKLGLDYAGRTYRGKAFRLSVAAFNERAIKTYQKVGFLIQREVTNAYFKNKFYIMIAENTPTIETPRLFLRKFTADDAPALLEILSDAAVNTFLPWFPLKTIDEAEAFLAERYLDYYDRPSAYRYAICLKEDGRPIGYAGLSDGDNHDFGYGLKQEFWHRGIVTEATLAIVARIKSAGYDYITATHDVNNPHSGAVMQKLGMTYKYSYVEQWQPKDFPVTFRMYQLNFDGNAERTYMAYWEQYEQHFVEQL